MRVMLWTVAVLAIIVLVIWLGFKVQPRPFGPLALEGSAPDTVPIPSGLPAPVDRFLRATYGGDEIPVLETVVLSGRGRIRPAGPWFWPARFRFIHNVGQDYRHYIETTWYGIPFFKVNEGYLDGVAYFEAPLIGSEPGLPNMNQGANLALWAEALMFPAALVLDPRVSWQEVDDYTALLTVPFEAGTETLVVRFDPETGLATTSEVMRYRSNTDTRKILWITNAEEYGTIDGVTMNVLGTATWFDQKYAWAAFHTEEMLVNTDLSEYIGGRGQ